jgi:hypothetical protein
VAGQNMLRSLCNCAGQIEAAAVAAAQHAAVVSQLVARVGQLRRWVHKP